MNDPSEYVTGGDKNNSDAESQIKSPRQKVAARPGGAAPLCDYGNTAAGRLARAEREAARDLAKDSEEAAIANGSSSEDEDTLQLEDNHIEVRPNPGDDGPALKEASLDDNAEDDDDDELVLEDGPTGENGNADEETEEEDHALLLEDNGNGSSGEAVAGAADAPLPTPADDDRWLTLGLVHDLPEVQKLMPRAPEIGSLIEVADREALTRQKAIRVFFEGADAALDATLNDPDAHDATKANCIDHLRKYAGVLTVWPTTMPTLLRHCDQGFFANFLSVLDAIHMAPAEAELRVSWVLSGAEREFTYAPATAGQCVWASLFEPIHLRKGTCDPSVQPIELRESRFNHFLRAEHKFEFRVSRFNASQRATYHRLFNQHIKIRHPKVLRALSTLGADLGNGVSIGVHKRIDTPGTRMNQGLKGVFSCEDYVDAAKALVLQYALEGRTVTHVYLATDDARAEKAFRMAFGSTLCVREGVQRVLGGVNPDGTHNEVHQMGPFNPTTSVEDAADVLCDALLLSKCGMVLHMDSNVSTAVSLMAPASTAMVHIADVLGRAPPVGAALPQGKSVDIDELRGKRALGQERKLRAAEQERDSRAGANSGAMATTASTEKRLANWQEPQAKSTERKLTVSDLMLTNRDHVADLQKEMNEAPPGWYAAVGRLWEVIMHADAVSAREAGVLQKGDPLTPLNARMLLGMTETPSSEVAEGGEKVPAMSKAALVELLNDPAQLKISCDRIHKIMIEDMAGDVAAGRVSKAAAEKMRTYGERGTTMAFYNVRKMHANGRLPVSMWPAPTKSLAQFPRLPPTTTAEQLWPYIFRHQPVIISGAFPEVVEMFSPPRLSERTAHREVPCRHTFRDDGEGRRVFAAQRSDIPANMLRPLNFGEWVRSAAAGEPAAAEVYPAKMPLPRYLPEVAADLEVTDNPFARFGACVGQIASEGVYMYAGAGANTTHTHIDPAENFMFVAAGSKRLQMFAPGDLERLYPWPAPLYHSCAVPPFADPASPPVEFPAFGDAHPIEVELQAGDMLYLPAYWYHAVQGRDGFNVVLAWWTDLHANKSDDALCTDFDPVRPAYTTEFMPGAVDELKLKEQTEGKADAVAVAP